MNSLWVKGLKGDEKKDIEGTYKSSARLREHMTKMLKGKEAEVHDSLLRVEKNGDWDKEVAEKIGELRAYKNFISLLK
jgi:hypothetical protein